MATFATFAAAMACALAGWPCSSSCPSALLPTLIAAAGRSSSRHEAWLSLVLEYVLVGSTRADSNAVHAVVGTRGLGWWDWQHDGSRDR